jgi:HEAT repeat protein
VVLQVPDIGPKLFVGQWVVAHNQIDCKSLSLIGEPAKIAVPYLVKLLDDESKDVRHDVVEALGRIGISTPAAVDALVGKLDDES